MSRRGSTAAREDWEQVSGQHAAPRSRLRRLLPWLAISLCLGLIVTVAGGVIVYRHLSGNITHLNPLIVGPRPGEGPAKSENVLLMGSDTREFAGGAKYGAGISGARSD